VLIAAIGFSIGVTLCDQWVFNRIDPLVGNRGLTYLGAHLIFITVVFGFAQAVVKVSSFSRRTELVALGIPAAAAAGVITVASFLCIGEGEQITPANLGEYAETPAAAVFVSVKYLYATIVLGALLLIAVSRTRYARTTGEVATVLLVASGCLSAMMMCFAALHRGVGIVMFGYPWWHDLRRSSYEDLQLAALAMLGAAIVAPQIGRQVIESRRRAKLRRDLRSLEPIWRRAVQEGRPQPARPVAGGHVDAQLHRRIVEIHDASISSTQPFEMSRTERRVVGAAELRLRRAAQDETRPTK